MTIPMTDAPRSLVERLRDAAQECSNFGKRMSEAKTARNRAAGDTDANYRWATPEQTLEGQAASALEALEREVAELKAEETEYIAALELAEKAMMSVPSQLTLARAQVREQAAKVAEERAHALRNLAAEYRENHNRSEAQELEARADELTVIAAAIRAMKLEQEP